MVRLEVEDVADVRAAPAVDRLVRVAADGQVPVEGREVPHEQVLDPVRVLVLVDKHVPESTRVAVADAVVGVEDLEDLEEQVVEVESVLLAHALLVALRHLDVDVLLHAARAEAVAPELALAPGGSSRR